YVRLRVSDTGEGMDRTTIEHAFEPFYTTKEEGRGTGLGLATVYGIVAQMGGDVRLYSEPGIGTTCSVMLPATGERPHAPRPDALAMTDGAGGTVLVVEDEDGIREVARRILTRRGFTVLTCADGTEAVELASSHEGPIELLITDVIMPGMMGREVAERLAAVRPGIRVIYMSGYAQPIIGSRHTLPPETILLEKPFTEQDIVAKIDEALRRPAPTTAVQRSSSR
ncbi:MAG: ATP-binding protein, partial [Solirubrobacteraceae bacterium]